MDAYYAQYDPENKWWTYVSVDKSLIIAHKQGSTVKDMGTKFFIITNEFSSPPDFSEDGKKITFGPLNGETCASSSSSSSSIPTASSSSSSMSSSSSSATGGLPTPPSPPSTGDLNTPPSPGL